MIHTNRFIALSCVVASVFATSCVNEIEEGLTSVNGEGYYISLTGEVNKGGAESRAHWDINSDDKQTPVFAWDASENEMKSFVWRESAFVGFTDGKKYSPTTVTPADTKNQAQLQITTGLSQAYAQNDVIWAVSPLAESNISDNKVTFTLPNVYTQTALNSTEHLKDYVLMSGTGKVGDNNTASISFDVLPAIYRFKVINNESETLTVNEVSISGPFCNKAVLSMNNGEVTPEYSVDGTTYTIKVAAEGLEVAAGATAYLYALVFPTNTASITDKIELSFKGTYGEVSANYTKTAKCNEVYAGKDLVNNTYNDMNVPVSKGSHQPQLPETVYFNDFEITENNGCTIHGDGSYQNEGGVWGNVFQNGSGAQRTHYLQLPADVLSHSTETQEMTIAFWVNAKNADAYEWAPMFTAYGAEPANNTNTDPMFACQSRGLIQINCAGWCDFTPAQNTTGYNTQYNGIADEANNVIAGEKWLADNEWHYYTVVLTATNAKVYLDGEIKNEWNVTDQEAGGRISGLFTYGEILNYICLGGNQAWNWQDNDAAFMFDDFAVYNEALTQEQIKLLISNKTN